MDMDILTYLQPDAQVDGYPIVDTEYDLAIREPKNETPIVDRVQITIGEDRYGLLLRHYSQHHWCGYVPVKDSISFHANESLIRSIVNPRISYVGYGNDYITWCKPNGSNRLKIPVQIRPTPDMRGDYWIGFDTRYGYPLDLNATAALAFLYGFENTLHRYCNDTRSGG